MRSLTNIQNLIGDLKVFEFVSNCHDLQIATVARDSICGIPRDPIVGRCYILVVGLADVATGVCTNIVVIPWGAKSPPMALRDV